MYWGPFRSQGRLRGLGSLLKENLSYDKLRVYASFSWFFKSLIFFRIKCSFWLNLKPTQVTLKLFELIQILFESIQRVFESIQIVSLFETIESSNIL